MTKREVICDRCGKVMEIPSYSNKFHIYATTYRLVTSGEKRLDLCKECYGELTTWIHAKDNDNDT